MNGVPGGNASVGTITQESYTAPGSMPSPDPVTITATSVQDPSKSASVQVTVFAFDITPTAVTVDYGKTQQFTLSIEDPNSGVLWQALYGRIDSNGLYRPPSRVQMPI